MKSLNLYIIITLLFFISCKEKKVKAIQFPVFKKETSLKGEVAFEKNTNFHQIGEVLLLKGQVGRLTFFKEYMILEKIRDSPRFLLFRKADKELIKTYGAIGKGPNEFLSPEQQVITLNGNLLAYIEDFHKKDLVLLDINAESTLPEENTRILKRLKFPKNIPSLRQFFVTKDSLLIAGILEVKHYGRFVSYDLASKETRFFGELPDVKRNAQLKEMLYGFVSAIRPDQSRYALAMHNFNRIEIYDSQGKTICTIGESFDRAKKIRSKDILENNLTDYYMGIVATNQYIFALKIDGSAKNFTQEKEVYVEVFDWDGNPVHRFILQEYAQGVAYDEDSKVLYSVNHWTHGNIYKYDISQLLK